MDQRGDPSQLSDGFHFFGELLRKNVEAHICEMQKCNDAQQERSLQEFEERMLGHVRSQIDGLRQEFRHHADSHKTQTEELERKLHGFQECVQEQNSALTGIQQQIELLIRRNSKVPREDLREVSQALEFRLQERSPIRVLGTDTSTDVQVQPVTSKTMQDHGQVNQLPANGSSSPPTTTTTQANATVENTCLLQAENQLSPELHDMAIEASQTVFDQKIVTADNISGKTVKEVSAMDSALQDPIIEKALPIVNVDIESSMSTEPELGGDVATIATNSARHDYFPLGLASTWNDFGVERMASGSSLESMSRSSRPGKSIFLRKRVLFLIAVIVLFALAAYTWKPWLTLSLIVSLFFWITYAFAEWSYIEMLSKQANATQSGFRKRKLDSFVVFLTWVKGCRSSHEEDKRFHNLLGTITILLVGLNPEVSSILLWLWSLRDRSMFIPASLLAIIIFMTFRFACIVVEWMYGHRRGSGSAEPYPVSAEAKEMLEEMISYLSKRSNRSKRRQEERIREIFKEAGDALLNTLLGELSRMRSFAEVLLLFDDSRDQARSNFLHLLCDERCDALELRSKFILLDALCCVKISSCGYGEKAVEQLFLSCRGDELSRLKSMQDGGNGCGNVHSVHQIVYEYIQDTEIRWNILKHFFSEGISQVAQRTLMANSHFTRLLHVGSRNGCLPEQFKFVENGQYNGDCGHSWLKIFTDIDDTLECSGGLWPAGVDTRYTRHTPYPGVTAFYKELQGGGDVGQLVALSARPHVIGHVVEHKIIGKFSNLKKNHGLHCIPAVLTGALDSSAKYLASGGGEDGLYALGTKKYENIVEFLRLYPEFRIVFIGDSGQADYDVAIRICMDFPEHVEQAWIHEVVPRAETYHHTQHSGKDLPIEFIHNFIDAAVHAATRPNPLIMPDGLHRVVSAAVKDFSHIENWPSPDHRKRELQHLSRSIEEARRVLDRFGIQDGIESLTESSAYPTSVEQGSDTSDNTNPGSTGSLLSRFMGRSTQQPQASPSLTPAQSPRLPPVPISSCDNLLNDCDHENMNGGEEVPIAPSTEYPTLPFTGTGLETDSSLSSWSEIGSTPMESCDSRIEPAFADDGPTNSVTRFVARLVGSGPSKTLSDVMQKVQDDVDSEQNEQGKVGHELSHQPGKLGNAPHEPGKTGHVTPRELGEVMATSSAASVSSAPNCACLKADGDLSDIHERSQDNLARIVGEPMQPEAISIIGPPASMEEQTVMKPPCILPLVEIPVVLESSTLEQPGEQELQAASKTETCTSTSNGNGALEQISVDSKENKATRNANDAKDENAPIVSSSVWARTFGVVRAAVAPASQPVSEKGSSSAVNSPPSAPTPPVETSGIGTPLQSSPIPVAMISTLSTDDTIAFEMS